MLFASAFLASVLLALTVSSSPIDAIVERGGDGGSQQYCSTPEQYSAYSGGQGLSPDDFVNYQEFSDSANAAGWSPPYGYKTKFQNLHAASLVDNTKDHYKTTFLSSYDAWYCAKLCDEEKSFDCKGFNIYYERAPKYKISKSDGSDCPNKQYKRGGYGGGGGGGSPQKDCCTNPVSITQIKCVELSYVPTADNAKNAGQYQNGFHVVIAGSDGFKKKHQY